VHKQREEWLRDIDARQRNVVFPDTVENEGRFWRNIKSGKLTKTRILGITLWFLIPLGVFFSDAARRFRFAGSGSLFDRLIAAFGSWAVLFLLFGLLSLVLRSRARVALRRSNSRNMHNHKSTF